MYLPRRAGRGAFTAVVTVALAFAGGARAQLTVSQPHVEKGEVRIGPPLTHTFAITNAGPVAVTVAQVHTTCGCLAADLDRRDIAPGATANLAVAINTLSQPPGPIAWTVRLVTSANEAVVLRLSARLIAEIRVEPAALAFAVREERSAVVTVRDLRAKSFRLTSAGASTDRLRVALDAAAGRLTVTARPDGPAATRAEFVWVATDDPLYPQIRVPVTLTAVGRQRLSAAPSSLQLQAPNPGLVQVRDRDDRPVIVDQVEVHGPLTVRAVSGPGRLATVKVSIDKSKWDGQPTQGSVTLHALGEALTIAVDVR